MAHIPVPVSAANTFQGKKGKSWYTIVGGPFEGVRFANYEREIRLEVRGHSNCRVFGHEAG
eukprot:2086214-Pleurochrysis_carterae.AAC.1